MVDCCVLFKSWLKCKGVWASCMKEDLIQQRKYSRRNQLKRSLMWCGNKTNGRLMAIQFLALTCFSTVVGTGAFCQPCCASTVVFESKVGANDGKPFSNAWDSDSGKVGVDCPLLHVCPTKSKTFYWGLWSPAIRESKRSEGIMSVISKQEQFTGKFNWTMERSMYFKSQTVTT